MWLDRLPIQVDPNGENLIGRVGLEHGLLTANIEHTANGGCFRADATTIHRRATVSFIRVDSGTIPT